MKKTESAADNDSTGAGGGKKGKKGGSLPFGADAWGLVVQQDD
jgi:hypothetical protein